MFAGFPKAKQPGLPLLSAMQSAGHGEPIVSAASHPPLQESQGRGTHSFGMGKETKSIEHGPTDV
jgi:hypothetical protein